MSEYRVAKEPLRVQLLLADGNRLEGTLFLASGSPFHGGPQTVGELMAEGGRTLPFHDPDDRFLLVGKAGVAAVLEIKPQPSATDLFERIPVAVRLVGGHQLEGQFLAERGAGARLSDALNADDAWLRLEDSDTLAWISKDHLLTVAPS